MWENLKKSKQNQLLHIWDKTISLTMCAMHAWRYIWDVGKMWNWTCDNLPDEQHIWWTTTWWTTYLMNNLLDQQSTWWTIYLINNLPDEQSTWWTTYLMNNLPDEQSTWWKIQNATTNFVIKTKVVDLFIFIYLFIWTYLYRI